MTSRERLYREAVDTLPVVTRAAFLLSVLDELDYEQIAFRLGITMDEVQHRIARALCAIDEARERQFWLGASASSGQGSADSGRGVSLGGRYVLKGLPSAR